ncbi:MAG: hypothetical protein KDE02_02350, partial [Rhodobacteraceae bacterium]|nr:hypothetical protein [Paracoccaceae bacterium]
LCPVLAPDAGSGDARLFRIPGGMLSGIVYEQGLVPQHPHDQRVEDHGFSTCRNLRIIASGSLPVRRDASFRFQFPRFGRKGI